MKITPEQYFKLIATKHIAFIGIGVSHSELIRQYAALGATVTLRDKRSRCDLGQATATQLENLGVSLILGEKYLDNIDEDIVFRTPGMRYYTPQLTAARAKGVTVTSELEMFFELCPCKIYAVTGSDGKTTSTTLIAKLLEKAGNTVHLGGNIGKALLPEIANIKQSDIAVVELSSFQLISMRQSPDVALVTNLAPNHLDMHADMQEYTNAKRNILLHQSAISRAVLNLDNEITHGMANDVRGELFYFSAKTCPARGAFLNDDGFLCFVDGESVTKILHKDEIRIPGMHNVENFLGVIATVWGAVSPQDIRDLAMEFTGVEHRIELVRTLNGVRYYNDSIASNPTRTIAGLACFEQRVILIAGGYDKKIPFTPLADPIAQKVKLLLLTGPTAQAIEDTVKNSRYYNENDTKIVHCADIAKAVATAHEFAALGDVVTLSPACASFDAYPNFEARGKHFKELVTKLPN